MIKNFFKKKKTIKEIEKTEEEVLLELLEIVPIKYKFTNIFPNYYPDCFDKEFYYNALQKKGD